MPFISEISGYSPTVVCASVADAVVVVTGSVTVGTVVTGSCVTGSVVVTGSVTTGTVVTGSVTVGVVVVVVGSVVTGVAVLLPLPDCESTDMVLPFSISGASLLADVPH